MTGNDQSAEAAAGRRARRSQLVTWLPYAILLVILPLLYASQLLPAAIFNWLVKEERPIELAGAFALLASAVFCFLIWRRGRGRNPRLLQWCLLGLGLLFLVSFAEEESWGQRVFGYGTPESVASANKQDEFNFHNLTAFEDLVNPDTLAQLVLLTLGVVIPVVALYAPIRARLERVVPVLSFAVAVAIVFNQLLKRAFDTLLERHPDLYHSTHYTQSYVAYEIKEAGLELVFAVGFWMLYRSRLGRAPSD